MHSPEQLSSFCSITGSSLEDAVQFLDAADSNFELAINLYIDSRPPPPRIGSTENESVLTSLRSTVPSNTETESSFEDLLQTALLNDKLALVFLTSANANANEQELGFVVWRDDSVRSQLESKFMFIELEAEKIEGMQFISLYDVSEVPFICIIEPVNGELLVALNQSMDGQSFIERCLAVHRERIRNTEFIDLTEAEQIERAVQESISSNQASRERQSILKSCSMEGTMYASEKDPNAYRIQIKMPNGEKVKQTFFPTDPVIRIFKFIENRFASQLDQNRDFELYFNGKRLFECREKTLEQMGLKNASLFFDYE